MKDSNFTLLDLKDPNTCLEGIWKHIPGHIRLTFVSAVILGLAALVPAHSYDVGWRL